MITIYHGYDFDTRLKTIKTTLSNSNDTLLILPSNRWERIVKKDLLDQSDTLGAFEFNVFSYDRFINMCYDQIALNNLSLLKKEAISPFFKSLIIRNILDQLVLSLQFYSFKNSDDLSEGIVQSILKTIEELINSGFDSKRFYM